MAQSYLVRVREALTGRDPSLYKNFLILLSKFTEDDNNSPVELYENICEVRFHYKYSIFFIIFVIVIGILLNFT